MRHFLTNQKGATSIEYAFIIGVVVLVMLSGLVLLGKSSTGQFQNVSDAAQKNM